MPGSCAPPTIILLARLLCCSCALLLLLFPHDCFVFVARARCLAETFDLRDSYTFGTRDGDTASHAPLCAGPVPAVFVQAARSKTSVTMYMARVVAPRDSGRARRRSRRARCRSACCRRREHDRAGQAASGQRLPQHPFPCPGRPHWRRAAGNDAARDADEENEGDGARANAHNRPCVVGRRGRRGRRLWNGVGLGGVLPRFTPIV